MARVHLDFSRLERMSSPLQEAVVTLARQTNQLAYHLKQLNIDVQILSLKFKRLENYINEDLCSKVHELSLNRGNKFM